MSLAKINKKSIVNTILKYATNLVLIGLIIFFALNSKQFLTAGNLLNILRQVSVPGIMAIGMATVIITGGIDLSVGSTLALCGIIAGSLMKNGSSPFIAVLVTLGIGIVIGAINGFIVNEFRIPPFVATLGTMTTIRGITYVITQGQPVYSFSTGFKVIGQGYVGPIPIPVIIMVVVYAFGYIFVEMTKYGRYIYGIGGNEEATRLSGISVRKVKGCML